MLFRSVGLGWRHLNFPDLTIKAGKLTFITGPSGCGKSTLFKLLNGTLSADRGKLYYDNRPVDQWDSLERRRRVLLAGQTVYLLPGSIADNFTGFYAYRDMDAPTPEVMRYFLDLCCADWGLDVDCASLSGGERQRVYLAIFLSLQSPVILLDEPTAALDSETAKKLFTNIRDYLRERNSSALVVSHDPQLTEQFADDVVNWSN